MRIITDEILHIYVLKPEILEKEMLLEIEKKNKQSEDFRERIEKIRVFYEEYEKIRKGKTEIENKPENGNIISLYPHEFNNNTQNNHAKLAANSETAQSDVYKYVKTFASAGNLIIMRLHHNFASNKYRLFLISEEMNNVANVRVKIPELKMEFKSDSEGVVELEDNNIENVSQILIEK